MGQDFQGKVVSEEEVAADLGFKDVFEMRRWQTDVGHENVELRHALKQAQNEAERFRRHGLRMQTVLDEAEHFISGLLENLDIPDRRQLREYVDNKPYLKKLMLAISVVSGRGVDWGNELEEWFESLKEEREDDTD